LCSKIFYSLLVLGFGWWLPAVGFSSTLSATTCDRKIVEAQRKNPKLSYLDMSIIASTHFFIPWGMVAAIAKKESGWRQQITGRDGEIGLMQIKATTVEFLKGWHRQPRRARLANRRRIAKWLEDPVNNICWGARYLQLNYLMTVGLPDDIRLAFTIAGYNGGHNHTQYLIDVYLNMERNEK